MKISVILTIIGWVLFLVSMYFRSGHAERRFGYSIDCRNVAVGFNFSALFCFLFSVIISFFLPQLNINIL